MSLPVKVDGQSHVKELTPSTHWAPFVQLFVTQSSMFVSQFDPVNPENKPINQIMMTVQVERSTKVHDGYTII